METTKKLNLKLQFSKHLIEDNATFERYSDLDYTSICGYCEKMSWCGRKLPNCSTFFGRGQTQPFVAMFTLNKTVFGHTVGFNDYQVVLKSK